ncbi:MAG: 3-deoxy-D-manno-octulosonic acid transferase [Rhodovarius sp.]|nr:3-deoxy-D-manno-octulosonic acid transferase [Rhodovarius sp.]MCX7933308.1 3-deoxy-D-manno-octulosonic acid transferase [Rhodovarius sp.]MDW8314610.1 3-deoxy-D-manno-octulosonic acid transferase [Rhodovarius sp.]
MSLIWHGITSAAGPLVPLYLRYRVRQGKEDPARLHERYGHGADRPPGILLWLHGASVGEGLALLPLLEAIARLRPDVQFLITTGTLTGAEAVMQRIPLELQPRVRHRFLPLDRLAYVARFLAGWKPDAAVFVESELWPNLILAARHIGVPLALVNARLSFAAAERWRRFAPGLLRRLLKSFSLIQPRTPGDAERLRQAGAPPMLPSGDLKASAPPLPYDRQEYERLRAPVPTFLAASTHPGEEELVAEAHRLLAPEFPGLRTIIVPRHPDRGAAIAAAIGASRRSLGQPIGSLHVADTLGELGLFYRLADVALVGGSLVPHGGHNPMEPARLGCPILFGPHTHNFSDRVLDLLEARAARRIAPPDAATLASAVRDMLTDRREAGAMASAARLLAERDAGTAELLAARLVEWLRPPVAEGASKMERDSAVP